MSVVLGCRRTLWPQDAVLRFGKDAVNDAIAEWTRTGSSASIPEASQPTAHGTRKQEKHRLEMMKRGDAIEGDWAQ